MRTGMAASGTPWWVAASACSNSVCPGKATPAADSASLCSGAVTRAAMWPCRAARAAHTTQSAAARPAAALTRPHGTGPGKPGSCSTGMQRGGTCHASSGDTICATGNSSTPGRTMHCAARRKVARSPTAKQPRRSSGASRKALATISGPIPAGSPCVMAMVCIMNIWLNQPEMLIYKAQIATN